MHSLGPAELRGLYEGEFAAYRDEEWARDWRSNYANQVHKVLKADRAAWHAPEFQIGVVAGRFTRSWSL